MKRIALITDGWDRYVTYAWIEGYRQYTACHDTDMDLYVFQSFGNFSKDGNFNTGEYNITRLPDLSSFDGILLDLANIPKTDLKNEIIEAARSASAPVISLLEKVAGLYFSGIDNYTAIQTVMEHLICKHHCRTLNYVSGPAGSVENQQRFWAYRDALQKYGIPFDSMRVTGSTYEIENGIHAFSEFQNRELLPDAFVCANDNIYTPVTHVFQESCHCIPVAPADRGQYVAKNIIDEVRQNDMQNWMMDLDRFLLDCNSFTELADHLHTWLDQHGCGSLNLLMNPDIFRLEQIDMLLDIPDDTYLSIGYPDQMAIVYPYIDSTETTLDLSSGTLIPHIKDSGKQNFYLFSPVHFREREIGYLILENCDYLLDHQFLFETLNTFRTAIEALYGKLLMRKKNKQLSQLYIHDSLTGLYNRMAYESLALPAFQQHMQLGEPVGIMFIDADRLKYINDSFGHDMGNLAISTIASVIRQYCPVDAIPMRYGGDEFVCIIPGTNTEQMQTIKQSIESHLSSLSSSRHKTFPIEASIGFIVADDPHHTLNDYINLADEQMYLSKKERKATRS